MKRFRFLSILAASIALIGLLWTVSDPQTTRTFVAKELPLVIDSIGPHAIGGTTSAGVGLNILGFTGPSAVDTFGLQLAPPITIGTPTNAATLKITGAPTGATNNFALWVAGGSSRFGPTAGAASGTQPVIITSAVDGTAGIGFRNAVNDHVIRMDTQASGSGALMWFEAGTEALRMNNRILALGTSVITGATTGDFVSTKGWTTDVAGAAHGNAAANAVTIYIREDIDVGAGTATADCAIRARKSDGTEVNVVTLVTDGGCP